MISSLVTEVNGLVPELGYGCGTGMVCGVLFGNQELARRVALSLDSDTHMGNLGSEDGSLRVGMVVLWTPLYHELSFHKSVPG